MRTLPLGTVTSTDADPPSNKLTKAAQQFEAMLLNTVMEQSEGYFSLPGSNSPEASSYQSLARETLCSALAAKGGIGLAKMLGSALGSTKVTAELNSRATGPPPAVLPVLPTPLKGKT